MSVGISAYALVNALGHTTREVLGNLKEGRSGLRTCEWLLPFRTECGQLPPTLPPLPQPLKALDSRTTRIAWAALVQIEGPIREAVERWGAARVGIVMGSSTAGMLETEHAYAFFRRYGTLPPDYSVCTQHAFHAIVDAMSLHLGVSGPRYVVSTACSSSAKALGSAYRLLKTGHLDAVVAGGADSLCQITLRGFHSLGILSESRCRPFAEQRDGINLGEGAALLLLEREGSSTVALSGIGESSDAHHMSTPDPEGKGACAAMEKALAEAELKGNEIDYVNAHGTGTILNDRMEAQAILDVCGPDVPVISTKGYTGHLLGAAGATEAVFAAASVAEGWVPASIGASPVDPSIGAYINTQKLEQMCQHVMSNSFAFGGSNAVMILSRTP
ncbi:MAG: beta-ketoacyl-ACP synthase [Myxococcales bacterium]|nr:beta-ketoacyl-ACP synthase [Myxococcales bacterium]MCB9708872.1 beta-ketoacyl-ACP synthase [Myxococcales bacterium]